MPLLDIVIPAEVGDVEECVVVTWLKKEGDLVNKGEDLLILQAEKVSFEVPAPATGTVTAILAQQGEVVNRNQPLARIEVSEVESAAARSPTAPEPEPVTAPQPPQEIRASPIAKRLAREYGVDLTQITGSGSGGRITEKDVQAVIERQSEPQPPIPETAPPSSPEREVRASPIAKRLAREFGIDLAQVPATGNRITEKDVRTFLEAQQPEPEPELAAEQLAGQTIPMTGIRATIAQRMHRSLQDMAQLTLHTEADVTELVARREQLKQHTAVTYTDLIVKACALALRQHPRLNATLDGDTIRLLPDIHIGLAVALDDGLIVPVIRHADQKSVADLARERVRLAERARANQLTTAEVTAGTFTVTNLGTYDIDAFTPIVNPPEVAILGVGRIVDKVVIYQGKIGQRSMMVLSLSFDHRLVDGAPAAAFLQGVKQLLEAPAPLG